MRLKRNDGPVFGIELAQGVAVGGEDDGLDRRVDGLQGIQAGQIAGEMLDAIRWCRPGRGRTGPPE